MNMIKRLLSATLVLLAIAIMHSYARTEKNGRDFRKRSRLEKAMLALPDSVFEEVKMEDLIADEVYMKLARDGWSPQEIVRIMNTATRDKKKAKLKWGYGEYAKQWLPAFGRMAGGDTLYQFVDTTFTEQMQRSVARTVPGDLLNKAWPRVMYDADDRKRGVRNPGYFRASQPKPGGGRMHWAALHPEDPDKLYAVPDGAGIFKTDDGGVNWTCITDNIPVRAHRSTSNGSAIPVDPDDWNHVFAFMNNSTVYESCDGGDSWRRIEGATHKGFKRGYCFRDSEGTLKFIGATQGAPNGWGSHLWISEDTCKTWIDVAVPAELKDIDPYRGVTGLWFQYVEFDPDDRDRIYIPTSRSILYFDDGARSTVENGVRKYNLKKMNLEVFNPDNTVARPQDYPDNNSIFPFKANGVGQLVVNPNNPREMWFATGSHEPRHTAVYKSEDRGLTWMTLHDTSAGVGSGNVFGNEIAYVWLGGFGVNFSDPNWLYGCSMSSAISSDGGRTFSEYSWTHRLKAMYEDGQFYTVSSAGHNADNHFILSHKKGRVFRGSDGGMLMKASDVNGHDWTNIGGNMGAMLFYRMAVNEFGDQAMMGNTQDINVQTFRYGRWGQYRGYEGSEISINPYTCAGHYSGGGTFGYEAGSLPLDSWSSSVARADVVTGSWYMNRAGCGAENSLLRIDDVGRSTVSLYSALGNESVGLNKFALARDKGHATIFVCTGSNTLKLSRDNGETFEPILFNGVPARFSNTQIAADPDNSDILYLGQRGKVMRLYVNESRFEQVGDGLPNIDCSQLFFHEGSGDLYFVNSGSAGIYILENGSDTWRFWTKGFNGGKFGNVDINYTTQEMALCDYGRGVWVADLEHPSDRYFRDGFSLKECSHNDGRRTIGIDTSWTIPLYYYYTWTVNGEEVDNPYQYLTRALNPGDRVQLRLTLRESPDVSTLSAVYTVGETASSPIVKEPGQAAYSSGMGRVDLGYTDYFFNDFTIDFWAKPMSDGVLMANRQLTYDVDVKGWVLYVEGGSLKFRYSPHNAFTPPVYDTEALREQQQTTMNGGAIAMGKWHHIALAEKRDGMVQLYIDGRLCAESPRALPEFTLNNSVCLSLFGDGIERSTIEAYVDEIKIWDRQLSPIEIREEMHSTNRDNRDGLVAYYNFNGGSLAADRETFSARGIRSRIRAEVSYAKSPLPLCARLASCGELEAGSRLFSDNGTNIIRLGINSPDRSLHAAAYAFNAADWKDPEDNLDDRYFSLTSTGYVIRAFDTMEQTDSVSVNFYPRAEEFSPDRKYRLCAADPDDNKPYWKTVGDLVYDASSGTLCLDGALPADVMGRKLVIVSMKPSIEVSVEGLSSDGTLEVYDDTKASYKLHARLIENLDEPLDRYEIMADGILQPRGGFYFTRGEADGEMMIDLEHLPAFNRLMKTTLRGKTDDKMIPIPVEVVNRITPRELGDASLIVKGGITVGESAHYSALNNSNTVTLMGWVRIDSTAVLSGTRPLIFFRSKTPSVATGIHLQDGNLRCHWNEESWSWNTRTQLSVTRNDLGRWVHLALVVRPDGVDYYLNGMKNTVTRAINKGRVYSPLMLGQNNEGDTWFSGAFDQVGVWNRSLSQDEVLHYMHNRVLLNDSSLVAYVTMDDFDDEGRMRESLGLGRMKEYGTVTRHAPSIVPYDSEASCDAGTSGVISLEFPAGKSRAAVVNTFRGTPYNFLNRSFQEYLPLNQEYYTVIYKTKATAAAGDTLTLSYRHPSILPGDTLAAAIRPLGSPAPLSGFIRSESTAAGIASFRIPYSSMSEASELMFFATPASGKRPAKLELTFGDGVPNGGNLMLAEGETHIPVDVRVLSGSDDDRVSLTVKESGYARLDRESVDMHGGETRFNLVIDREQIDKLGLNPVTVNAVGAEANELTLNIYLEPKVELRLKNGEDPNTFVATTPITTLDVEAELIEGWLEEDVVLTTVADMSTSMNIGNGSLLLNQPVSVGGIEYYPSSYGKVAEGWNLIGNPYLADINLTKGQNVSYDPERVTKFVYNCNAATGNFSAYDMTDFDAAQQIHAFQSFFVQTMDDAAVFTVTPVAKETSLSKRTMAFYAVEEQPAVRLQLLADGRECDEATVRWEDGASPDFVVNEDASKLWSLSDMSNQLYMLAADGTPASISAVSSDTDNIRLGLKIGAPGEMELRATAVTGFNRYKEVYLVDNATGTEYSLSGEAPSYKFRVEQPGDINGRFSLKMVTSTVTGIDPGPATGGYRVATEEGACTVTGLRGDAMVSFYTPNGRLHLREHVSEPSLTVSLPAGLYIVKIRENEKDYVSKIVVK